MKIIHYDVLTQRADLSVDTFSGNLVSKLFQDKTFKYIF